MQKGLACRWGSYRFWLKLRLFNGLASRDVSAASNQIWCGACQNAEPKSNTRTLLRKLRHFMLRRRLQVSGFGTHVELKT